MNSEEYVAGKGKRCLACGADSSALDGGQPVYRLPGSLAIRVRCLACDGQWDEVYTLTGVEHYRNTREGRD